VRLTKTLRAQLSSSALRLVVVALAERYEVREFVTAAVGARDDVMHLELPGAGATDAASAVTLQHLLA